MNVTMSWKDLKLTFSLRIEAFNITKLRSPSAQLVKTYSERENQEVDAVRAKWLTGEHRQGYATVRFEYTGKEWNTRQKGVWSPLATTVSKHSNSLIEKCV